MNYTDCLPGVPTVEFLLLKEALGRAYPYYGVAVALRDNGFAIIDFPKHDLKRLLAVALGMRALVPAPGGFDDITQVRMARRKA